MKHFYTDHITSYLFNECSPEISLAIEAEMAQNEMLRKEFEDVKNTLLILQEEKLSPSQKSMDRIMLALTEEETINQ